MDLASVIAQHKRAVLFLSAGKDSLACLLLLKDFLDRIDVVWVNPGAPHQRTVEYMHHIRRWVPRFREVSGRQPEWLLARGWPVDVLPVRSSIEGEVGAGRAPVRFQSYLTCCEANMWAPMREFIKASGADLVIMGQRAGESMRNRLRDDEIQTIDGVTYWHPINSWTEAQVWRLIDACGHPHPPFYDEGAESSADCWNCTAYLDHNRGRLEAMKRTEPDRYQVVESVLMSLSSALLEQQAPLKQILEG